MNASAIKTVAKNIATTMQAIRTISLKRPASFTAALGIVSPFCFGFFCYSIIGFQRLRK